MKMHFEYTLINTGPMTAREIEEVEDALAKRVYVCQQEFEKHLDVYHQINVLPDADGEAFISQIKIDGDTAAVTLDCAEVGTAGDEEEID